MKKTIIASQTLALAAAGKLAVQSNAVSAADMLTSGSKLSAANQYEANPNALPPPMRMDQFCTPLDVCMPPTDDFVNDFDSGEFSGSKFNNNSTALSSTDGGGKAPMSEPVDKPQYFSTNGVIFAGDVADFGDGPRPKIDFIISNVPNKTLDMFLLYSDRPFGKKEPGQFDGKTTEAVPEDEAFKPMFENAEGNGDLGIPLLDAKGNLEPDLKFITGMRIEPQKPVPGFDADGNGQFDLSSPLGKTPTKLRTVVLTVQLDKLSELVQSGQIPHNVFFQVAAFPANDDGTPNINFPKALYSDVDQFIIEVPGDEGPNDTGTKGGVVSSNIDPATGSKNASSGGGKASGGNSNTTTPPATNPSSSGGK